MADDTKIVMTQEEFHELVTQISKYRNRIMDLEKALDYLNKQIDEYNILITSRESKD